MVIRIKHLYLLYNLNGIQFKSRIITEKFIYLSNKSMAEFHKKGSVSEYLQALKAYCVEHQYPCFPLSAITREGLPALVTYLGKAVLENKASCISKC